MFVCVPAPPPSGYILFFFLISKTGLEAAWCCSIHQKHFLKHVGALVIIDMSLMFDFQSFLSSGLICQENQQKEAQAAGSCLPSPGFVVCGKTPWLGHEPWPVTPWPLQQDAEVRATRPLHGLFIINSPF